MPPADFHDLQPVYRVNPPPPQAAEPPAKPAFDPTARPIWGPLFTDERPSRGYRVRPEEVWQKAKREYLDGYSAEAVCAEFDLGLSAFRQRARREGWRRSDAAEGEPACEATAFPPEPEAAPPTDELVDMAWRSMAQAIRRGKVYEARAWMKLHAELKAAATADERAAAKAAADAANRQAKQTSQAMKDVADVARAAVRLYGLHPDVGVQSGGDEEAEEEDAFDMEDDIAADGAAPVTEAEAGRRIQDLAAALVHRRDPKLFAALADAQETLAVLRRGGAP